VQLGINMGLVQQVNDADGKPSLVGDGLDDAQRVMCFANPNQILVSHAYYESASKLTHEISQMFEKYDMHTLEHDVYAVRLLKDVIIEDAPSIPADISEQRPSIASKVNWRYIASVSLGLLVFYVITKVGLEPSEPTIILDEPVVAATSIQPEIALSSEAAPAIEVPDISEQTSTDQSSQQVEAASVSNIKSIDKQSEVIETMASSKQSTETSKKTKSQIKAAQKVEADAKSTSTNNAKLETNTVAKATVANSANKAPVNSTVNDVQASAAKHTESKAEKSITKEKSGWESFKEGLARGAERECTQGEIAMNQCVK
jgi:hypothetical protein